ncbi:MAG TPA: transcription termination/antitermination protein NusA, partial [Candidatus Dormibacteraeota bacterium]
AHVDLGSGAVELFRPTESGGRERVDDPGPDFSRQAALAVRGAVGGWLREAERDRVLREGSARRGELIDTIVERPDGDAWWLRNDRFPALLPVEEQIPGETPERNRHLKVVVVDVRRRGRDAAVVVSRSHPNLVRRLLEQEVPEMASGQIAIRAIAREPGRRTKVAVYAAGGTLDAEGACIGPRGVRHRAVVAELAGEQLHIVGWSADPEVFCARALAPAEVVAVELDETTRTAHVTVAPGQLSLAIGRSGENARLAARLTGWRIDIRSAGGEQS